jgi:hypothetical protein
VGYALRGSRRFVEDAILHDGEQIRRVLQKLHVMSGIPGDEQQIGDEPRPNQSKVCASPKSSPEMFTLTRSTPSRYPMRTARRASIGPSITMAQGLRPW